MRPLPLCELKTFIVKTKKLVERKCEPLQASHRCNIRHGKDMTGVQYGVTAKR